MNKRSSCRAWALVSAGLWFAMTLLVSTRAQAYGYEYEADYYLRQRFMVALDVEYAAGTGNAWLERGGGATLRIGAQINQDLVTLIPELTLGYHTFHCYFDWNNARLLTGMIGSRVRFFRFVEPGFYAHLGLGTVAGDWHFAWTGLAVDVGATLDLTVIRIGRIALDLGFHVSWNRVFGGFGGGFSYVLSGAHAALVF